MEPTYKKFIFIAGGAALALAALYLLFLTRNAIKSYNYIGRTAEPKHEIFIMGEGRVFAAPDIAKIRLGLTSRNAQVQDAQKENTEKMNKIVEALKDEFKIEAKDIKTTDYSIYPEYDYNEGRQTLRGYTVSQNLDVKIRDLTKLAAIIGRAGQVGLNQVGGLTFDIDEPEKIKTEAREIAIKKAKEKAEALARAANVKLGRVTSISESGGEPPPIYRNYYLAEGLGGDSPEAKIEAGQNEIVVQVTLGYEIL